MKTPLTLLILVLGGPLAAFSQPSTDTRRIHALELVQTEDMHFPFRLEHSGVMQGEAWVVVSVAATGELEDVLVTGYTRREFADEAVAALRRWQYRPALADGRPIPSAQEYRFTFSREGVVVDGVTVSESVSGLIDHITEEHSTYRAYSLHELDKIPVPVRIVSPSFPRVLASAGKYGQVTVSFYIDEEGKVRMPAVLDLDNPELASLAVQAVSKWQFQPPRSHNQPVLVYTSQEFDFKPKS